MRFQDNLLLQKQHAEERERAEVAQAILDEASKAIDALYAHRSQFRDPLAESQARIKILQRKAASSSSTAEGTKQSGSVIVDPDYITKEVTVRHLNENTNLNPQAFKLYRRLRFG
jgi:hypothetical protein